MSYLQALLQIGKNGLTDEFLKNLKFVFKKHEDVKINILKSAGHTKENVKDIADKIKAELGDHYTYKIVGFTIFFKKWRKAKSL
jgi:RNA-binding protein YhbY